MFTAFVISKSSFQILCQFFLLLYVGKILTKYSVYQFCSYYGLAGKSRQFSFFLGLRSYIISYRTPAVFFLLPVVANWERCFTLSLSFAFFNFGPKLPESSLAYLSNVNRGLQVSNFYFVYSDIFDYGSRSSVHLNSNYTK